MADVSFKEVTEEDVRFVLANLAKDNVTEILATGLPEREFLNDFLTALRKSPYTSAAVVGGKTQMISGVVPDFLDRQRGLFWLVFTEECKSKYWVDIARWSKKILNEYLKVFEVLYVRCNVENVKIRRWIRWMGFAETEPVRYGVWGIRHCFYYKFRE